MGEVQLPQQECCEKEPLQAEDPLQGDEPLQMEEQRRLEEENEALRLELERMRELTLKERIYDRVHVSVRTLDIFIAVMILLGIGVVILGILNK